MQRLRFAVCCLLAIAAATGLDGADGRILQEHEAKPARVPAGDPNLVNQDGARVLRSITRGLRPRAALRAQAQDENLAWAAFNVPTSIEGMENEPASKPENIVIDVLVAYTKKAASYYADITRELVDRTVEEANQSFRRSNIGHIKLRIVHAYQTDYVEQGDYFDHVWRFADRGDDYMEEVHRLRDMYRADVAVLLLDDPQGCGLATRVLADADEAFAVVHHECAITNYTVAHEIGHLIGARHDLGYVNGTKWRDIMSHKESCGGCPRVPVWSSPTVLINGERAGTAELDNARVIAEQAARVSAFR